MKFVITGGGTGGHIYPALEIARELQSQDAEIIYLGSNRGQERSVCQSLGIQFHGFGSAPLYSLKQVRGWKSLIALLRANQAVKRYLSGNRPMAVFSTGGYSAAPVMYAARALRIPLVIHEANSMPGRSNRMFAPYSKAFSCVFEITKTVVAKAQRTGQPIRKELRDAVSIHADQDLIFCMGGSQGSEFLNGVFPKVALLGKERVEYLLAAGRSNFEKLNVGDFPLNFKATPYLETSDIVQAYQRTKVAVARSGGTVAELAMFGIPSVLIPLPTSADDHQLRNAEEFVRFGGAKLLRQTEATPERLAESIDEWLKDEASYRDAQIALRDWDRPDATPTIAALVTRAGT